MKVFAWQLKEKSVSEEDMLFTSKEDIGETSII